MDTNRRDRGVEEIYGECQSEPLDFTSKLKFFRLEC